MQRQTHANEVSPDLATLRRQVKELIARNALVMVQHVIDSVNEDGQHQALKCLFEMIGLYPAPATRDEPGEPSLAATLLQQLGIHDSTVSRESKLHDEDEPLDPVQ